METTPGRLERRAASQAKVFIGGTCLVGLRLGSLDLNEPKAFIAAGILLWRSLTTPFQFDRANGRSWKREQRGTIYKARRVI